MTGLRRGPSAARRHQAARTGPVPSSGAVTARDGHPMRAGGQGRQRGGHPILGNGCGT